MRICILTLMTVLSTMTFADVSETDFNMLKDRVTALEKIVLETKPCFKEKADGFIIANSTQEMRPVGGGKWAKANTTYRENFEFEIIKPFTSSDGLELLAVRMASSGYNPSCGSLVVLKNEVFLY